ncbi:hypothetical protein GCM10022252_32480 [Streptosporangium oxazolinicum]|uniref:Uncharacterized protein n=1 Tax=Streptosporangium oxazolinicum TaxID=909287 RepID=A0ABP8AW08_9ACTN
MHDDRSDADRPPYEMVIPVSLPRIRIRFFAFAVLAVGSAFSGASIWLPLALTLTCVAILLAVAATGGRRLVHSLFLMPSKQ